MARSLLRHLVRGHDHGMAVGADDIARVLHVLHVLLLARHRLKSNESADAGHVRWVHALGHGIWCHTHHCWVHRYCAEERTNE